MKILYAIQGTGNGHLSRARDIIPLLLRKGAELDIMISGTQADVDLDHPVSYRYKGLSFIFGKKGGVNMWKTYIKANTRRLQKEIQSLPVENYDLVINDFEPVSAWSCKLKNVPCVGLSHQAAVLATRAPKPKKKDPIGRFVLKNYAPCTTNLGFHFQAYQENIFTPIIRNDIRNAEVLNGNHYTVYLPSYSDKKIMKVLAEFPEIHWDVFSKHNRQAIQTDHIRLQPINNREFVQSMAKSKGILCGAGFETPAEALYLKKKLMVIPMKGQYEQQCNAAALKEMGVTVLKSLKKKHIEKINRWLEDESVVKVDYPNMTQMIIDKVLNLDERPIDQISTPVLIGAER